MKVKFAWYDIWIGIFIDTKKKVVYVCPLPMCLIQFSYQRLYDWLSIAADFE